MKLVKILDTLPPPKFLDIPFAGISITDEALHCIQLGKKSGKIYIEKYAERPIAPGIVVGGQVNNPEELKKILQNLKKDLNLNYVKVSLPEEKAYLFTDKIPVVRSDEIRGVIESTIEENVPLPGAELVFDYKLDKQHEKDHLDVVVSALPVAVVESYINIIEGGGLFLLSLEIESQAITRAVLKAENQDAVLIACFGKDKVGLYIASNRIIHFTSTVVLKSDLPSDPSYISQEIKKLFAYWNGLGENADRPEKKIKQIIVCGDGLSEDIIPYLSVHNETPAFLGNVWSNVFNLNTTVPIIPFNDSLKYAAAIGLALHNEILI